MIEKNSKTWLAVEEWANKMLYESQKRLESPLQNEQQTARLRGNIEILRKLLSLTDPPKETAKIISEYDY